jgi:signal transduction histidine kinase
LGKGYGLLMSVLSVAVWVGGDLAAGARYSSPFIPIWNALILTAFYYVVVVLLASLRAAQRDLENRVEQRTEALTREMAERKRLEKEMLHMSEREQHQVGLDLHDGLCQHLTATALAGQVLVERLGAKSLGEAADANQIVGLVEEGITMARNLACGLYPVEMEADGLMSAFQELADNIAKGAKIQCVFECTAPVLITDDSVGTHLYRIAQEAVRNAIRHGEARHVAISLAEQDGMIRLTVEDDGVGMPAGPPAAKGLGLRIMAHRASLLGGTFTVEPALTGGTVVTCSLRRAPEPAAKREIKYGL